MLGHYAYSHPSTQPRSGLHVHTWPSFQDGRYVQWAQQHLIRGWTSTMYPYNILTHRRAECHVGIPTRMHDSHLGAPLVQFREVEHSELPSTVTLSIPTLRTSTSGAASTLLAAQSAEPIIHRETLWNVMVDVFENGTYEKSTCRALQQKAVRCLATAKSSLTDGCFVMFHEHLESLFATYAGDTEDFRAWSANRFCVLRDRDNQTGLHGLCLGYLNGQVIILPGRQVLPSDNVHRAASAALCNLKKRIDELCSEIESYIID